MHCDVSNISPLVVWPESNQAVLVSGMTGSAAYLDVCTHTGQTSESLPS